jgi:hypothetical protein
MTERPYSLQKLTVLRGVFPTFTSFNDEVLSMAIPLHLWLKDASFKFSMGGLAGQVRAAARRSEYLTRVEEAS